MASCGGLITTSGVTLDPGKPALIASSDEQRQVLTIKSNPANTDTVYLLSSAGVPVQDGWPMAPGEGLVIGGSSSLSSGPRAAVYAVCASRATVHLFGESGTV